MILTSDQKEAIYYNGNILLTACPGSGKTRVIISKLLRTLEQVRETPRVVACITYTNAAVLEIESRLLQFLQPGDEVNYTVGTIHSFCLNNIFRNFSFKIKGFKKGFKVLTPESDEFEAYAVAAAEKFGRRNLNAGDIDEFAQLRIDANGNPIGGAIEKGSITPEMAKYFWEITRAAGYVDFTNIIYYTFLLLKKCPEILEYASSKFAWVLVDEFQDTTDLQVEILSLLHSGGKTGFFLVGDLYQSIFRFAGARPELANAFAKNIGARTDLTLSGNFRSSSHILAHAEQLLPRIPAMSAVGKAKAFSEKPVFFHGKSAFEVITDYFLPALEGLGIPHGESAILAPSWYALFPLGRSLRKYGISIVGPGARPYRWNRHFAPLAEQVCGYLIEQDPAMVPLIERTLFNTLLHTTGRPFFDTFSYSGRKIVFQLLYAADDLYSKSLGGVQWLESAAIAFSDILIKSEYLTESQKNILLLSVEEMKADMTRNRVDLSNLTVEDLGMYANPKRALKLSTLHNSKGHEYSAVAMIDLHEGKIPSYYARTVDEIEEQKRLFYVGLTRAKRYLLYATDDSGRRNGKSRFLTSLVFY